MSSTYDLSQGDNGLSHLVYGERQQRVRVPARPISETSNPYDLSTGNKGFPALVISERIIDLRNAARHIRASYAVYDSTDPRVAQFNQHANELERKALELENKMRERE